VQLLLGLKNAEHILYLLTDNRDYLGISEAVLICLFENPGYFDSIL